MKSPSGATCNRKAQFPCSAFIPLVVLAFLASFALLLFSDDAARETQPDVKKEEKLPDTEDEALFELARRTTTLIDRLLLAPENDVEAVSQELLLIGQEALPFLLGKLSELRADRLIKVIDQINYLHGTLPTDSEKPSELGLCPAEFDGLRRPLSEEDAKKLETLLYQKYLEAIALYKAGKFEQAHKLAEALIIVERRLPFRPDVQRLKVLCEEALLTSRLVAARLAAKKRIYEVGETIEIVASMENLTAGPLTIELAASQPVEPAVKGAATVTPGKTHLFLTIEYTEYDPYGSVHSIVRQELVEVEPRITLSLEQPWRHSFNIETLKDNPLGMVYKEYKVMAEMRFASVSGATTLVPRRIVFEPLTLRVFPQDVDPILRHPLEFFIGALDAGSPIDILLGAMLVPEKDQLKAVEFMIKALPHATQIGKRVLMNTLRLVTKAPVQFDEQAWIKWWEGREGEKVQD